MEEKPPALTEKDAELDAAATVTEAGAVSNLLLDERTAVIPEAGAFLLSVTVQLVEVEGESVAELQTSAEMTVGATREMVAVAEVPL